MLTNNAPELALQTLRWHCAGGWEDNSARDVDMLAYLEYCKRDLHQTQARMCSSPWMHPTPGRATAEHAEDEVANFDSSQ